MMSDMFSEKYPSGIHKIMEPIIILGVFLALLFNFVNGLNDAGNSIATIVATRALTPAQSLAVAAVCNIAGPFILTTAIAQTIGTSVVNPVTYTSTMLIITLISSVILVYLAVSHGFPISASHALIGCMIGSAIAASGFSAVLWPKIHDIMDLMVSGISGGIVLAIIFGVSAHVFHEQIRPAIILGFLFGFSLMIPILMIGGFIQVNGILAIISFIVISPTIGFIGGFIFDLFISYLFRFSNQHRMKRIFLPLQVMAGGMQAVGHGANDGLHAVGMIGALFIASGMSSGFSIPFWVMATSSVSIGLGTVFGGWKVITKIATKITKIRPYQGFCASMAGGSIIGALTLGGIPSSTTHIINGAIVGVGATRGKGAVNWDIVREIVTTWIITIPLSVITSWILYVLISPFFLTI